MTTKQRAPPKHRIVSAELELNVPYSFTLNLADTYRDYSQCYHAYTFFMFKHVYPYCDFRVNFEHSAYGRLHVHGEIMFVSHASVIQFLRNLSLQRSICAVEIDTISDPEKWSQYCYKQYDAMEEFHSVEPSEDDEGYHTILTNQVIKKTKAYQKPVHHRDVFADGAFQDNDNGLDFGIPV